MPGQKLQPNIATRTSLFGIGIVNETTNLRITLQPAGDTVTDFLRYDVPVSLHFAWFFFCA